MKNYRITKYNPEHRIKSFKELMFMCSLKCFENKGCEEPKIAFSFSDIINNQPIGIKKIRNTK